jgi:hypothetical protein
MRAIKATDEFRVIRQQSAARLEYCRKQWRGNFERSSRFVAGLTGLEFTGRRYRVLIMHPGIAEGSNHGSGVIRWGGREAFPNYTSVYLWHEILHDFLPRTDLGHVLVQFATDDGLRHHLNGGSPCSDYVGHENLRALSAALTPDWLRYRRATSRGILELHARLQSAPAVARSARAEAPVTRQAVPNARAR